MQSDQLQTLFTPDLPYADIEIEAIIKQEGYSFEEVITLFTYLGRCTALENNKLYYWYMLKGGIA
ncbi:hypothetical protein [Xanthocytophaga agilis]|uniref:Uncharacterized protein n=1 Tax=Xanthocytophaga agilis TaxID=3048010 RepID=A0AAE3R579_9BACT|nr:hypothetical protein [Xanthocytophaga agilis]MDJ1501822.1 hypothetical protein [Xanthocytophaga agilis]